MSLLARLLATLGMGREALPAPSAPPPAPAGGIPVLGMAEAAAAVSPPPPPAPLLVTPDLLQALAAADPAGWAPLLSAACQRRAIRTPRRLAAFLATVLHESSGLRRLVEGLDYTPQRLREIWRDRFTPQRAAEVGRQLDRLGRTTRAADQPRIAEIAYGGRLGNREPGDGWRYRGRGLIQVTGRDNYIRLAVATGRTLAELVDWLETREGAAESAALWWDSNGCNALADAGDLRALRQRVNGGAIGLLEVERRTALALAVLERGGGLSAA